jgi:DNA-directed RNA polymerase subunit RPC12/RpoP
VSRTRYTRDEEARLEERLTGGGAALCPRCGIPLERHDVTPSQTVSYVRRRALYVCGRCGGSLVVDRTREPRDG